jgi:hypothetical protein
MDLLNHGPRTAVTKQTTSGAAKLRLKSMFALAISILLAASMWFYVIGILRARQVAESEVKGIPRGNLSDLYPRWLGARELLLHHSNPYSSEVALEIQEGYYGRRLDSNRPNDPKDRQGFAYPVYVIFLLAPLIGLPFHTVQIFFYWVLIGLTALSVWLWLRAVNWRLPTIGIVICTVLTLGSIPAVQGIKLQQLSLLAAALLAGAAACVASGFLFSGGVLLALATIKPQLAWLFAAWMMVWAFSDWSKRRRVVFGFGAVMAGLLIGAEFVLPGWLGMFADAVKQYHGYTQNQSVLDVLAPWIFAGKLLAVVAIALSAWLLWKLRSRLNGAQPGRELALVMALTVLVVPMYAPYNQVMLLPPILVLLRDWRFFWRSRGRRFLFAVAGLALAWQWIASVGLSGVYLLESPVAAMNGWKWPFFATFALPVLIFVLIAMDVQISWEELAGSREQG